MMKILVYTFESFVAKEALERLGEVVAIRKPKADIEHVCSLLVLGSFDLVLGVAKNRWMSTSEPVAVNDIHGLKIDKGGLDKLSLFVPSAIPFSVASRPTRTFCNYTMYKVAKCLKDERLDTKFIFFHLRESDVEKMVDFIEKYSKEEARFCR